MRAIVIVFVWLTTLLLVSTGGPDGVLAEKTDSPDSPRTTRVRQPSPYPVHFDSEWIRLSILGDSLEVQGTYVLCCRRRSDAQVTLFYPFPADSLLGGARMVSLRASVDGKDQGPLPWREDPEEGSGVRWDTPPCTGDTIAIETVYRQKLLSNYARYIVTTTQAWPQPLRRARFDVRLPSGSTPGEFSFPFFANGDSAAPYYRFETEDFRPDRDIVVRWRTP